eukprot:12264315-Prorocentrum_lima.AAC.1
MTSSLVGSEMCIRDRDKTEKQWYKTRCPLTNGRGICVRVPVGACTCQSAVSYTHLTLPTICSV